jgi:hypothetical protein
MQEQVTNIDGVERTNTSQQEEKQELIKELNKLTQESNIACHKSAQAI